eukprot:TRINITY_DN2648_c0_g2_i1.p1 TRINITY_DN2648_c0_g2~~TRINITY_DN2648_c0_g2_i1.p1  ORF type:complete len:440 (+),score=105.75 TRINITY_DN2648_c0_g2_i1:622-1941(+)
MSLSANAVIIDQGYDTTKFGFSHSLKPSLFLSSQVGIEYDTTGQPTKYIVDDTNLLTYRENCHIKRTIGADSFVSDSVLFEKMLEYGFDILSLTEKKRNERGEIERFEVDFENTPIFYTEPYYVVSDVSPVLETHKKQQTHLCQFFFEKCNAPCMFIGKQPCLSAFTVGKSDAYVLNFGASGTSIIPVRHGRCLNTGAIKINTSEALLDEIIINAISKLQISVIPKKLMCDRSMMSVSLVDRKPSTDSYRDYLYSHLCRDIRWSSVRVSGSNVEADQYIQNFHQVFNIMTTNSKTYTLPDGKTLATDAFGVCLGEVLVRPAKAAMMTGNTAFRNYFPIASYVKEGLLKLDNDIRKDLLNSIVVTGGMTKIPGLVKRLQSDLEATMQGFSRRIFTPIDPVASSFFGASIMCSVPAFEQMWISKAEYEEFGDNLVYNKFSG